MLLDAATAKGLVIPGMAVDERCLHVGAGGIGGLAAGGGERPREGTYREDTDGCGNLTVITLSDIGTTRRRALPGYVEIPSMHVRQAR